MTTKGAHDVEPTNVEDPPVARVSTQIPEEDAEHVAAVAYLLVFEGSISTMVSLPRSGRLTVGRGEEANVRLQSVSASRLHAEIEVDDDHAYVRDLGSRNGTRLNGERIEETHVLRTGDVLQLAGTMIVYHTISASGVQPVCGVDRDVFRERAEQELERSVRAGRPFSLLSLEIDGPKNPREAMHEVERWLRAADLASWADDGGVLALLPETDGPGASVAAERLVRGLANHARSVRAAVATYPADGAGVTELLDTARDVLGKTLAGHVGRAAVMPKRLDLGGASAIIGDPAMFQVFARAERLSRGEVPVLVEGETGVGKELVASALHLWSSRKNKPFVSLNCAAMPDSLVESEPLGYERGAFTGANSAKVGLIEAADGGTLFLDEIAELPVQSQAKLLRVLESKRVRPLGNVRERDVDVRLVTATNRDLEREVAEGRFRKDLYFRLRGATIHIPPLRERKGELRFLLAAFLDESCLRLGHPRVQFTDESIAPLESYTWPGNVRELRSFADYVATTTHQATLAPDHLAEWLGRTATLPTPSPEDATGLPTAAGPSFRPLRDELRELERARMEEALAAAGGNQTRAAQLIGVPLRTFMAKAKSYGLGPWLEPRNR